MLSKKFIVTLLSIFSYEVLSANDMGIFVALLKKDTLVKKLGHKNDTARIRVPQSVIVRARFINPTSRRVFILNKEGTPLYSTDFTNIENIDQVTALAPKIDPLEIFEEKLSRNLLKGVQDNYLSHFFSFSYLRGNSDFQPRLLGGESNDVSSLLFNTKNYYITPHLPVHLGFNLGFFQSTWENIDQNITSQALLAGPSFLYSFLKSDEGAFHLQTSFFHSLRHVIGESSSELSLKTTGWQVDLEREFQWSKVPVFIAVNYRWTKSEVTSPISNSFSTEDTSEKSYGFSVGYRFNWAL